MSCDAKLFGRLEVAVSSSLKERRLQQILEIARENGQVGVAELSHRFDISDVTVRRDLRELDARGLLRRAHGGAVLVTATPPEAPVIHRMNQDQDWKERIGLAAAGLVQDGESVFIGSGSTTAYVARHLRNYSDLTVVTNALNVAIELAAAGGVTVVVTGGLMRPSELSLIGHIAGCRNDFGAAFIGIFGAQIKQVVFHYAI